MVGACHQHCSYVAWAPLWLAEASVHQIRLLPSCRENVYSNLSGTVLVTKIVSMLLWQKRCHMLEHPLGI